MWYIIWTSFSGALDRRHVLPGLGEDVTRYTLCGRMVCISFMVFLQDDLHRRTISNLIMIVECFQLTRCHGLGYSFHSSVLENALLKSWHPQTASICCSQFFALLCTTIQSSHLIKSLEFWHLSNTVPYQNVSHHFCQAFCFTMR
jgi:hypothetical protein